MSTPTEARLKTPIWFLLSEDIRKAMKRRWGRWINPPGETLLTEKPAEFKKEMEQTPADTYHEVA